MVVFSGIEDVIKEKLGLNVKSVKKQEAGLTIKLQDCNGQTRLLSFTKDWRGGKVFG